MALAVPSDPWEEFYAENYFSKFMRSGVTAVSDLITRGVLESDATITGRLASRRRHTVHGDKPPHIVMVFDEFELRIRAIPEVKIPPVTARTSKSSDGKQRSLIVEGAGGPSWFTEYNVLTGLSARSYGRFADFVTRIAAGRVERGLPHTLGNAATRPSRSIRCTARLSARGTSRMTAGIQNFLDSAALGSNFLDPDAFYFNAAADTIAKERRKDPLFLLVYTAQNHFPWNFRFRPDLAPEWRDLGNRPDVDEYLRRQHLSAVDYQAFVARLARDFPGESFLIVRFGDHQPYFARNMIDPRQDDSMVARRIAAADPRFLTTYYAINTINFTPRDISVCGECARCALSAAGRAGGGGRAARSLLRGAEEDPAALPGAVLSLQRRRRGAALQPAADRRRADQGAVGTLRARAPAHAPSLHPSAICGSLPRQVWPNREGTHGSRFWRRTGGRRSSCLIDRCFVTFRLADGGAYTAVQGCALDVADGEFVAIVGPTGCGKSTLLNVAAGLIAPSKGPRRSSAQDLPASIARPATCFRPRPCSRGRPRPRTSRSAWRSPAPQRPRRARAPTNG